MYKHLKLRTELIRVQLFPRDHFPGTIQLLWQTGSAHIPLIMFFNSLIYNSSGFFSCELQWQHEHQKQRAAGGFAFIRSNNKYTKLLHLSFSRDLKLVDCFPGFPGFPGHVWTPINVSLLCFYGCPEWTNQTLVCLFCHLTAWCH